MAAEAEGAARLSAAEQERLRVRLSLLEEADSTLRAELCMQESALAAARGEARDARRRRERRSAPRAGHGDCSRAPGGARDTAGALGAGSDVVGGGSVGGA